MKKPKYKVGQHVFYIEKGECHELVIQTISFGGEWFQYSCLGLPGLIIEDALFPSVKKLITKRLKTHPKQIIEMFLKYTKRNAEQNVT